MVTSVRFIVAVFYDWDWEALNSAGAVAMQPVHLFSPTFPVRAWSTQFRTAFELNIDVVHSYIK